MSRFNNRRDRDYDNTEDYGWRDHDPNSGQGSRNMGSGFDQDTEYGGRNQGGDFYSGRQMNRGDFNREQDYGGSQRGGQQNHGNWGRGSRNMGQQYDRDFESGYGRGQMSRGGRSGGDYDQGYGGNWDQGNQGQWQRGGQQQGGFDRGQNYGGQSRGDWNRDYGTYGPTQRGMSGFNRDEEYGSRYGGGQNYDYERGGGMSDWEYGGGTGFNYGYSGGRNQQMRRTGPQSNWGQQWNESRYSQGGMNQGQRGRFSGRGPQGYTRSDERIQEEVNEHLTHHGDLDAWNITVRVENGEVTLEGHVEDRWQKRMAEDVADEVSGVKQVHNHLRVQQNDGGLNFGGQQGNQQSTTNQSGQQTQNRQSSSNQSGQSGQNNQSGQSESQSTQGRTTSRTKQTT